MEIVRASNQSRPVWSLTGESFAKFLSGLDADRERAGEKYQALRESLIKFLDWRGSLSPEELVDETFNRVARKLEEGETIKDLPAYCHGVARLVFLQWLERKGNRTIALNEIETIAAPAPEPEDINARLECLKHCLSQLPADSRQLITEYYRSERRQKIDNRAWLASRLGIPLNALRSRAQRIRDKLEQCVMRCCRKNSAT